MVDSELAVYEREGYWFLAQQGASVMGVERDIVESSQRQDGRVVLSDASLQELLRPHMQPDGDYFMSLIKSGLYRQKEVLVVARSAEDAASTTGSDEGIQVLVERMLHFTTMAVSHERRVHQRV